MKSEEGTGGGERGRGGGGRGGLKLTSPHK